MSYLCLFVHSGVPHILCCGFFFIFYSSSSCALCTHCCQIPWIVHSSLTLRFSLTFIVSGLSILV